MHILATETEELAVYNGHLFIQATQYCPCSHMKFNGLEERWTTRSIFAMYMYFLKLIPGGTLMTENKSLCSTAGLSVSINHITRIQIPVFDF
jgi:hypothetical protein